MLSSDDAAKTKNKARVKFGRNTVFEVEAKQGSLLLSSSVSPVIFALLIINGHWREAADMLLLPLNSLAADWLSWGKSYL